MPLPTPKKGEKRDAFVSRCMANATTSAEFPSPGPRYAVCLSQWSDRKKRKTTKECLDDAVASASDAKDILDKS